MDDYEKFISEAFRVLKPGGIFFIFSHLDQPAIKSKMKTNPISYLILERYARYIYFKKYHIGKDDHTFHFKDTLPIERELFKNKFSIEKKEVFKRHFYIVAKKK
jgi:ubiquinone/menaquinone biosynthesis C-methylase UbiE